jgi:sulfate permease, SulP family
VPQGVAFAIIAGLPPEYGLYTAMVTAVIAAWWGSSFVMVSGPTTAISAVVFTTLSAAAIPGTPPYVALALALTIVVGCIQLAAGLARLGGLIAFISHSVIVGFTAAAALLIASSQLAGALGLEVARGGGVVERIARVAAVAQDANPIALGISALTLGSIVLLQRLHRRLPAYLIALALGALAAWAVGAGSAGIAFFAPLPSITPQFGVPRPDVSLMIDLLPGAAAIAFIGLLEAISIGRAFSLKRGEDYDANQEIVGQGLSNIVGGFLQAYAGVALLLNPRRRALGAIPCP